MLVSKFESGFAARLNETIARLPELFEPALVAQAYDDAASSAPSSSRVAAWHIATEALLATLSGSRGLSSDEQAEVQAGIDSVAALLDSILWTAPLAGDEYVPLPGEVEAYRQAMLRLDTDLELFTRFYGEFEGASVVNYCPGAQFARLLVAQAWTICTGSDPPTA